MSTFEIKPKDDEKPAKPETLTHIEVHVAEDAEKPEDGDNADTGEVNIQPPAEGTVTARVTHSAESEQEDS